MPPAHALLLTGLLAALGPLTTIQASPPAPAGWHDGSVTDGQRTLAYHLWVPKALAGNRAVPLLLVLHGCTQDGHQAADATRLNEVADRNDFLAVYPDQPAAANGLRCWNWFLPEHQARGGGEPLLLSLVIAAVMAHYPVDAHRIFVAGLSAGAAMAVILGATYPDLVGAIAVGAGGEYKAAEDAVMGVKAMQLGGPDPDLQGTAARDAMGAYERRVRVIVFHGDLDLTVRPVNADQIVTQWAQTNDWVDDGLDDASVDDAADATRAGQVPGGHAYDVSCYDDAEGRPLLEKWIVHGMRHAWSGGDPDEAFTDPAGPDASAELWRYFSESGSGCDG